MQQHIKINVYIKGFILSMSMNVVRKYLKLLYHLIKPHEQTEKNYNYDFFDQSKLNNFKYYFL